MPFARLGWLVGFGSSSRHLLWLAGTINLFRKGHERPGREDRLHRETENLAEAKGELEARAVVAPLEIPDRLIVHADAACEVDPGHPPLRPQYGKAVVDLLFPVRHAPTISDYCANTTICS